MDHQRRKSTSGAGGHHGGPGAGGGGGGGGGAPSGHPVRRTQTTISTIKPPETVWEHIEQFCGQHLNFYRVHMLAFIVTPLIASAVFYASNGTHKIAYVDALFMCTSAMTVTGLNSVLLASLTRWQQVMLFLLMCLGSTSGVSLVTILIRRHFFRKRFKRMLETDPSVRARVAAVEASEQAKRLQEANEHPLLHPLAVLTAQEIEDAAAVPKGSNPHIYFNTNVPPRQAPTPSPQISPHSSRPGSPVNGRTPEEQRRKDKERKAERERIKKHGISADMVRRIDAPVRVNAMSVGGHLDTDSPVAGGTTASEGSSGSSGVRTPPLHTTTSRTDAAAPPPSQDDTLYTSPAESSSTLKKPSESQWADPMVPSPTDIIFESPMLDSHPSSATEYVHSDSSQPPLRRPVARRNSDGGYLHAHSGDEAKQSRAQNIGVGVPRARTLDPKLTKNDDTFPRTHTVEFHEPRRPRSRNRDEPNSTLRLRKTRTTTTNGFVRSPTRRQSLASVASGPQFQRTRTEREALNTGFGGFRIRCTGGWRGDLERAQTGKPVSYITFDAVVGRNSKFEHLTAAQQEELGGVEYRALCLLLKLVAGYWLGFQLLGVVIIAPWLASGTKYESVFTGPGGTNEVWYSFFQVSSAYTNCGMSLIDSSLTEYQDAHLLIVVVCVLILAGNTAFPIFLRLLIWILSKVASKTSQTRETLQFLLDHPRRCFIYLFPSYQTWFLLFSLVVLNCTDWVCFLILDIGNPVIEAIPVGTRVLDGLLQSVAVRAAGFQIVALSSLAPAVQLLYVVMMYIAVYPIALSIRSSNVYEERSMGIFEDEASDDSSEEEEHAQRGDTRSYIAFHARKQLSFDLWWLVLAVWVICIAEKNEIQDKESLSYFNIFACLFEITSAYGTVGLSLGLPYTNTSFSGAFTVISKLVVVAVMIRGRHRGLPIAVDRAILLPTDLEQHNDFRAPTMTPVGDEDTGNRPSDLDDSPPRRFNRLRSVFGGHKAAAAPAPSSRSVDTKVDEKGGVSKEVSDGSSNSTK